MTTLSFTKMHGLGNDIVIIDCLEKKSTIDPQLIRKLADRHTGIGFDQLMTIEISQGSADFFCRIFNPDGSSAEQCGNGLRCVARYLYGQKKAAKSLTIETIAGIYPIIIEDDKNITVSMSCPKILEEHLVLSVPYHGEFQVMSLSVGNPHIIIQVDSLKLTDIKSIGPLLATHPHFSMGTNVGFMQIDDKQQITLRTYERGAGLTLACGSNACAAVVAGITEGLLHSPVTVMFERGSLSISWDQKEALLMTGTTEHCFKGEVMID